MLRYILYVYRDLISFVVALGLVLLFINFA